MNNPQNFLRNLQGMQALGLLPSILAADGDDPFGGIFSMEASVFTSGAVDAGADSGPSDPDLYRPSLQNKNVKNGVYKARLRGIPNVNDRNVQKVGKYIYNLQDPTNPQRSFVVDCPASKNNIVTQAFFYCKDAESAVLKKIGKDNFGRKEMFWALFLIMMDDQQPDVEGMIKIMRYGQQIHKKIELQGKDDPSIGKKGINVFDPFKGKDLILDIRQVKDDNNRDMTSYEQSYFMDTATGISFDKGNTQTLQSPENMKALFDFFKEKSPDLSKHVHQEWDEETEAKVIASVRASIADEAVFQKIWAKSDSAKKGGFPGASLPAAAPTPQASPGISALAGQLSGSTAPTPMAQAGIPGAGIPGAGIPSAAAPAAGIPSAGIPVAGGIPSAGIPSAGIPVAGGIPSAGIPVAGGIPTAAPLPSITTAPLPSTPAATAPVAPDEFDFSQVD